MLFMHVFEIFVRLALNTQRLIIQKFTYKVNQKY